MPTEQQQRGAAAVGSIRILTLPRLPKMEEWLKSNRESDKSMVRFGAWYDREHEKWRQQVQGLLGENFNTIRLMELGGVDTQGLSSAEVQALIDAALANLPPPSGSVTIEQVYQIVNAATATFIWNQNPAAAEWIIQHHLGRYPPVTVVDSGGSMVFGQLDYQDANVLKLSFADPFGGTAYLG